ncbi:atherin-like [Schistocerca nitens]|uniref:atherin-like n=1 Tax=Schistocerca nitens TaxID=7011 RepID=UPI00211921A1|nr:atherin-like [Schistocerca nitens]
MDFPRSGTLRSLRWCNAQQQSLRALGVEDCAGWAAGRQGGRPFISTCTQPPHKSHTSAPAGEIGPRHAGSTSDNPEYPTQECRVHHRRCRVYRDAGRSVSRTAISISTQPPPPPLTPHLQVIVFGDRSALGCRKAAPATLSRRLPPGPQQTRRLPAGRPITRVAPNGSDRRTSIRRRHRTAPHRTAAQRAHSGLRAQAAAPTAPPLPQVPAAAAPPPSTSPPPQPQPYIPVEILSLTS